MTRVKTGKPVKRITEGPGIRGKALIVELRAPNLIGFRCKGERDTVWITAEAGYWLAAKQQAAEDRRVRSGL